jgi:hypothetical protein
MVKKAAQISREQILENLLRSLLEEVSVRDGMHRLTHERCAGCQTKNITVRACNAAWTFLEAEEFRKTEMGT